jgi:membrane protein
MIITPLLYGDAGALGSIALFLGHGAVAGGLCVAAVAMLMRFAPEHHQPIGRVGFGSLVVVGAWVLMSGGFGVYLREIASYGSVFSSLATVVVLMAYLYLSAVIFLGGIQIDALVREQRRTAST